MATTEYDVKKAQAKQKMYQAQLKNLANVTKAKMPKGLSKNKQKLWKQRQKQATAEYKKVQMQLKTATADFTKTQNKYWTDSGQYDKLLKGENRDAYLALQSMFKSFGLESLAGKIYEYVQNGYSSDTVSILLQDTPEYKKRFAGNEARVKAGLPVMTPNEYLQTEAAYRQVMQSAGLPVGFYDKPDDFAGWIGQNVSPSEIQSRVDLATQATVLANPAYKKALNAMGISDADLTAYWLDQKKALPFLQKAAATATIGAESLRQNLAFDKAYAEQLATMGVTGEQARAGYSNIASNLEAMQALGRMSAAEWDQRTAEEALFEGKGEALTRQGMLLSRETGRFKGGASAASGGLAKRGGQR